MLDPKVLRGEPEKVKAGLKNRKADLSLVDEFTSVDEKWRKLTASIEEKKARRNVASEKIGELKRNKGDASALLAEMKGLSDEIKELETKQQGLESELNNIVLNFPNLPDGLVPIGEGSGQNTEIRSWGTKPSFSFKPLPHDELGARLGILDFARAAKIARSRFVVYRGFGAALERALISFMLDLHIKEHGYTEVLTPLLVNADSLRGTGQLPKFAEDLFRCQDDDLYLIPTAEVPVTNLHRDEILELEKLPLKYVAYTPCFRREAGSYGKDVKGIIRQHQFNKVELVKFTTPESSPAEHEQLTADAEKVLQKLNLPYRVVQLCTGDLGFASANTYDLEVWFPSENQYREISSCSNFGSFQARRAGIRYRPQKEAKPEFVHTINGSGLAVGRTFAAIIENYQQEDGSIVIPDALRPYLGGLCKFSAV
ncbi:MAG: serine--tRNA ligase [Candidatus Margulisbacteria bacterium]|nr:serine--tRNA ligase [Candidatus Margulisiibacteriota bacterium]MBU1616250.1 serine--tRNA ligase [Candidatus Margulisiibacteriota bacterium]MBU1867422.1 serine--tRNA ligase [Candidatus Margulisiibacteriota bacterium]